MRLLATTSMWWPLIPRLLAGGPLVFFGLKHFQDPAHFRSILVTAGVPQPDLNVVAASAAELLGGVLLLLGLLSRVGGLLGVATMAPAILTTIQFMGMAEHPFVPPLPVPVVVLLCSAVVLWVGGGSLSADAKLTSKTPAI